MKKRIFTVLLSLTIVLVMAVAAEATTATKAITVDYVDIQLYVNGNAISLQADEEPFIYNGRTFVPIRFVAEALNQNVEWFDWLKTVKITGSTTVTDAELAAKEQEIKQLKLQLAEKGEQIQDLKDTIESLEEDDDGIGDLEDDLISDYDYLEDVSIDDISLDGDEDDVDVTINVDLDDYGDEWDELDDSDIDGWIEDMVDDIQYEFSEDTVVTGEIIDTDSDDVLVSFDKDGEDSLDVDFEDEDYRGGSSDSDVEDVLYSLENDSFHVDDIEFSMDISYDDDDESVTAYLDAEDDDAASEWDGLSSSSIDSDVEDICEEITEAFDDDAGISLDTVTVYFYDKDGDLLDSFDYDVDNGELDS